MDTDEVYAAALMQKRRSRCRKWLGSAIVAASMLAYAFLSPAMSGGLPGWIPVAIGTLSGIGGGLVIHRRLSAKKRNLYNVLAYSLMAESQNIPHSMPRTANFITPELDISKNTPMIVDAAVNIQNSETHFRERLNPEAMRRLLLSIDHTASISH